MWPFFHDSLSFFLFFSKGKNSVAFINVVINFCYEYFCFEISFPIAFSKFFFEGFTLPVYRDETVSLRMCVMKNIICSKRYENATSCISQNFQSVFALFISSCYYLHNKVWIAIIELFLRFQYQCVRKENNSLSLSLSLSLHLINYYVIYKGSLFSDGFIFYGLKFIVECKASF